MPKPKAKNPMDDLFVWPAGETIKNVDVTDAMADEILRKANFENNRLADNGHIDELADMMVNGQWVGRTKLTIAMDGDGVPYLVDGQHRLRAFRAAALRGMEDPMPATLELITDFAPKEAYALLDSAQKKRSPAVIAVALELPVSNVPLLRASLSAGKWALKYAGMTVTRPLSVFDEDGSPREIEMKDRVSFRGAAREYVMDRRKEFATLGAIMDAAKPRDRRICAILRGARVLPVVLETLAAAPSRAERLWGGVVDGVGVGELATSTREKLLERAPEQTSRAVSEKARFAAVAWNTVLRKGFDEEPKFRRSKVPVDEVLAECSYKGNSIKVLA